jgi:hypothetical protein
VNIKAKDKIPAGKPVSAKVTATNGAKIIVERAMYAGSPWSSGHATAGVTRPEKTWYLAEGSTHGSHQDWVLVMNPTETGTNVKATFMLDKGEVKTKTLWAGPHSRQTIYVNEAVGPDRDVSVKVESLDGPGIIVERAMYDLPAGAADARWSHAGTGLTTPGDRWYLAEGSTQNMDCYILIMNPADTAANIHLTYMLDGGGTVSKDFTVGAHTRFTISAGGSSDLAFGPGKAFSTKVESTNGVGVIVERAMYGGGSPAEWGTASYATPGTSTLWFLAEGTTGSLFDTWVLIMNPYDEDTTVRVTFMLEAPLMPIVKDVWIPRYSRKTIWVNHKDFVGPGRAVSTKIESLSTVGVVVERAMYIRKSETDNV